MANFWRPEAFSRLTTVARAYWSRLRSQLGIERGHWVRRALWQRHPGYWKFQRSAELRRFKRFARRHSRGAGRRERSATFRVVSAIVRATTRPALLAGLWVVMLAALDHGLRRILSRLLSTPSATQGDMAGAAELKETLSRLLIAMNSLDWESYGNLLATAAQVSGILLGLHFATLGLLASTSYRDVPADIRALAVQEKTGTVYLRLVAFTGAVAVYLLLLLAIQVDPGATNALGMAFLSASAVLSFVPLGISSFRLFDAESLSAELVRRFRRAAADAAPKGLLWSDRSTQAHASNLAAEALDSLRDVAVLAATGRHAATSLRAIAERTLALLRWYGVAKGQIPPESLWFKHRPLHHSYLGGDHEALHHLRLTGSGALPTPSPDVMWVERRATQLVAFLLNHLIQRCEFTHAIAVIHSAESATENLLRVPQVEVPKLLQDLLLPYAPKTLGSPTATTPSSGEEESLYRLATVDALFAGPPRLVAAFGEVLRREPAELIDLAETAVRAGSGAPFGAPLPSPVQREVRTLRAQLALEKHVEGQLITPDWYVKGSCAAVWRRTLHEAFEKLLSLSETAFSSDTMQKLSSSPETLVAVIERGRETLAKLRYNLPQLTAAAERLRALYSWSAEESDELDVAAFGLRFDRLDDLLINWVCRVGPHLSRETPNPEVPDAFGMVVSILALEAFDAILENRSDRYTRIIPVLLELSLAAHDRALAEHASHHPESRLILAADPVVDVLEVSGYAYFVSRTDFHAPALWESTAQAWDGMLSRRPEARDLIGRILELADMRSRALQGSPREFTRINWRQRFHQRDHLAYSVSETGPAVGPGVLRAEPIDLFAAAQVRRFGLTADMRDVFIAAYLLARPEAAGLDTPRGATELLQQVERVRRYRASKDATDDGSIDPSE